MRVRLHEGRGRGDGVVMVVRVVRVVGVEVGVGGGVVDGTMGHIM